MFNTSKPYSRALQHLKARREGVLCPLQPVSAFCIVSHAAVFVSSRKDPSQGGGRGALRDLHRFSLITQTQ